MERGGVGEKGNVIQNGTLTSSSIKIKTKTQAECLLIEGIQDSCCFPPLLPVLRGKADMSVTWSGKPIRDRYHSMRSVGQGGREIGTIRLGTEGAAPINSKGYLLYLHDVNATVQHIYVGYTNMTKNIILRLD